jgi:hypothetical protein
MIPTTSTLGAESKPRERISLCAIVSPVGKTHFMQAADLFERFKVLIEEPIHLSGYIQEGNTTETCIAKTRAALEGKNDANGETYRVIAIWRAGHAEGAYWDNDVRVVSTGHSFAMFHEILRQMDFPLETKFKPL